MGAFLGRLVDHDLVIWRPEGPWLKLLSERSVHPVRNLAEDLPPLLHVRRRLRSHSQLGRRLILILGLAQPIIPSVFHFIHVRRRDRNSHRVVTPRPQFDVLDVLLQRWVEEAFKCLDEFNGVWPVDPVLLLLIELAESENVNVGWPERSVVCATSHLWLTFGQLLEPILDQVPKPIFIIFLLTCVQL